MKITIIQGAFFPVPPLLGGAVEKRWFRLAQEFASLGHSVTQISRCHGDLPNCEVLKGVNHIRVQGYDQPGNLLALKFRDLLYSLRACRSVPRDSDIVITNTFWSPLTITSALKKRVYVDVARTPQGQCKFYKRAARLRGNSTPVADAIRRELPEKDHSRVTLIPNPLPFSAPSGIDLDHKKKQILFCGRVHPEKGLDLLVKAAHLLPDPWTVEIVGPWEVRQGGGGEGYVNELKRQAGAARVHFHGPVFDMEQLAEHYKNAAIFVYPSVAEKGETFGLAPLEAMAWGCVPVVSDISCFKDFIKDGLNGLVFDHRPTDASRILASKTLLLTDDASLRSQLAREACKVALTHSPAGIAKLFISDFEKVLEDISPQP